MHSSPLRSLIRRAGVALTGSLAIHALLFLLTRRPPLALTPAAGLATVQVALAATPVAPSPPPPAPPNPPPTPPAAPPPPPPAALPPPENEDEREELSKTPAPVSRPKSAHRADPSTTDAARRAQALEELRESPPAAAPAAAPIDEARAEELHAARASYLDGLWSRLREAFLVPGEIPASRAQSLRCRVAVRVLANGRIVARIATPSGDPAFDSAVLDAVADVNRAPVAPPPEILPQLDHELTGPFHLGAS